MSRGIDPGLEKKAEKLAITRNAINTFGAVAGETFSKRERETAGNPFKRDASTAGFRLPSAAERLGFRPAELPIFGDAELRECERLKSSRAAKRLRLECIVGRCLAAKEERKGQHQTPAPDDNHPNKPSNGSGKA